MRSQDGAAPGWAAREGLPGLAEGAPASASVFWNYHQVSGRLGRKWSPLSYNSSRKQDLLSFRDKDRESKRSGNSWKSPS